MHAGKGGEEAAGRRLGTHNVSSQGWNVVEFSMPDQRIGLPLSVLPISTRKFREKTERA